MPARRRRRYSAPGSFGSTNFTTRDVPSEAVALAPPAGGTTSGAGAAGWARATGRSSAVSIGGAAGATTDFSAIGAASAAAVFDFVAGRLAVFLVDSAFVVLRSARDLSDAGASAFGALAFGDGASATGCGASDVAGAAAANAAGTAVGAPAASGAMVALVFGAG